jgi:hypothetical protein
VRNFGALPGNGAVGRPKQYCYIQPMATGMPLCIPPRRETHYAPKHSAMSGNGESPSVPAIGSRRLPLNIRLAPQKPTSCCAAANRRSGAKSCR